MTAPDLATQLFFPAGKTRPSTHPVILSHDSSHSRLPHPHVTPLGGRVTGAIPVRPASRDAWKTVLVEGVPVRVPTRAEMDWLITLPTEEYLVEVKRIWVIMALDTLKVPGLPMKDVLYLVRKIIRWSKK